ncbi:hypothetical protein ACLB2K_022234 [Fragaria x ananassa]
MDEPRVICPWGFLDRLSDSPAPSKPGPSNLHRPKTFASVLSGEVESQVPISKLSTLVLKGDTVYVKINEHIYQDQIKTCRTNLIGRLLLQKGTTPLKTDSLKQALHSLWQPLGPWRLVPIGKGFFDIHFNSEADMLKVWGGGTCTLAFGLFRLSQWQPDFKPGEVLPQTHAQVWIKIYGLSQEYWHHHHIMEIAHGVGTPLQLDAATKEQRFGYYARVLVDINLLGGLPTSVMVEREHHSFPVRIEYEHLPSQCSHCGVIGHERGNCRQLKKQEAPLKEVPVKLKERKAARQEYRVKVPIAAPVSSPLENSVPIVASNDDNHPNVVVTKSSEQMANNTNTLEIGDSAVAHLIPNQGVVPASPIIDAEEDGNPLNIASFVNQIVVEAGTELIEEIADKVFNEGDVEQQSDQESSQSDSDSINNSAPRSWNDVIEEVSGELHDHPPGFMPKDPRAVLEMDAIARYATGEDIEGFIPVLTNSQKKAMAREKKLVQVGESHVRASPYPARLITMNNRGASIPNIWLLSSLQCPAPSLILPSEQQITAQFTIDGVLAQYTFIYAATTVLKRRQLWDDLYQLRQNTVSPWMAIGDCNAVLGAHECTGGRLPVRSSCDDFRNAMNRCEFTHLDTSGAFFTWSKGRGRKHMERRLDRSLCDDKWLDSFPNTSCMALPRVVSDHNSLLFTATNLAISGPKPFRFKSMWSLHSSFKNVVANC